MKPQIRLRMMVYTIVEDVKGNFGTKEVAFEPHPFEASVARDFMLKAAKDFIDEQTDRLNDLYRIIK